MDVLVGLLGIPVFTQGGGPSYVFQPTFGYLIGFIFGAYIIGKITENLKSINIKNLFLAGILGLLVIYLFGVSYMYVIYNFYLGDAMSLLSAVNLKSINIKNLFLAGILGLLVIYLFGVSYMYVIYNFYLGDAMSLLSAVSIVAIACLPSDLLLTFIISLVGSKVCPRLKRLDYI